MEQENSEIISILTGEILLLDFLSKSLYVEPDEDWISTLFKENLFDEVPFAYEQNETAEALKVLTNWIDENMLRSTQEIIKDLKYDYARLFIGLGKVLAPPWESVYFNVDHLVFQEQTLQVRDWYRRFNIEPVNLFKEPDDHIGLELSFLSYLTQKALDAHHSSNLAEFQNYIKAEKQFLAEHVLNWAPYWCTLVYENAQSGYYKGLGLLTLGCLLSLSSFYTVPISLEIMK